MSRFFRFLTKKFSYSLAQINVFSLFDTKTLFDTYKNITVLSSTKMLFGKHSIQTFECYFERHAFDSIIDRGKLVQKLSSKQLFFENMKIESNSRFLKYSIRVYLR